MGTIPDGLIPDASVVAKWYLRDEDLAKLKSNIAAFLDSASKQQ